MSSRPPDTETVDGTGRRSVVLLIEDDPTMRELVQRALATSHEVRAVGSAEEAELVLRRDRPDAIVCDLVLPGRSGEAFVERLRRAPRYEGVPLIVITGLHDEGLRVRLLRSGATDFLEKPFSLAELDARVANALAPSRRYAELQRRSEALAELADQLQGALTSRVPIEQAKAFVAAERRIGLDEAFELLRREARSQRRSLHAVATEVVRRRGLDAVDPDGDPVAS